MSGSAAKSGLAMLAHSKRVRVLYKTILKLHRGLPPDLAYMGDAYVRDEFKRHKKATPEQTIAFMESWAKYAITVSKQMGIKGPQTSIGSLGVQMTQEDLNQFSETQLHQLFELYSEATKIPEMKDN